MAHRLADLGLPVITQPGFLFSKGDQYLADLTGLSSAACIACRIAAQDAWWQVVMPPTAWSIHGR